MMSSWSLIANPSAKRPYDGEVVASVEVKAEELKEGVKTIPAKGKETSYVSRDSFTQQGIHFRYIYNRQVKLTCWNGKRSLIMKLKLWSYLLRIIFISNWALEFS